MWMAQSEPRWSKDFSMPLVIDRDVNGARGIFLRGLLFLEGLIAQVGLDEGFA